MKIDFHVHTRYSYDSIIHPKQLAKKSKELGIIPAITDHDTMEGSNQMRSIGAESIPGIEIRTDRGDLIGLYVNEPVPKGTPVMEALDKIHEQGGISYLPHMYEARRSGIIPEKEEISKIDIVEVFNARCLSQKFNDMAKAFAEKNGILQAAGTDSHFIVEFGSTYTELPDFDLDSPKKLLKALRRAKFVAKQAPFRVTGATILISWGKKLLKSTGLR